MVKLNKIAGIVLTALLFSGTLVAQPALQDDKKEVTFRFVPGKDMFYTPWAGNGAELERLYTLIDEYRNDIVAGTMPVYVDSYCASLPSVKENWRTAFIRANRVKSELILRKGLKEDDFITKNYATAHNGKKDVVVVTLRIPVKEEPKQPEPLKEEPKQLEPVREEPKHEKQPLTTGRPPVLPMERESAPVVEPPAPLLSKPYSFAVRTNILYDAFLLPTLGVEWRIHRDWGLKLDGSCAWWGDEKGKVQKIWLLNPEVRWYLLRDRRFYVGASANFGKYNVYKYMLGNLFSGDTGYQGTLWGAGLAVGYQLFLSHCFSLDFNVGVGYTHSKYDSFGMINGVRVGKDRDKSKNFWGPTQAGISLVWTIGSKQEKP